MHRFFRRGLGIAGLYLLAPIVAAKSPRDPAADLAVMKTLPVYVIAPAVPLRATMPVLQNNEQASMRAARTYGLLFNIASKSPLLQLVTFKSVQTRVNNLAVPGLRTLREGGCLVDDSGANMGVVDAALEAAGLGAAPVTRVESDKDIPKDTPRIVMFAASSFTPDYAALITSYGVEVYAPTMPDAPSRWKVRPSLSSGIAVVADSLQPPTLARDATEEVPLPAEPESDDDGSSGTWPLAIAARDRAATWAQDACARVNAALEGNRGEGMRLLSLALVGQIPKDLPDDWNAPVFGRLHRTLPTTLEEAAQRRLYADGQWLTVSRRAGDDVVVDYRFAWLPSDVEASYDKQHAATSK
ncbi:hypothetical protein [Pseudoxanthomonas sp. PXM02]|uniref:hypothetical protein n=1 Tax=Pseudoxanthomonas sp. PXM02 TaxID=2769294 RepID=UPI00177E126A|nr:hypothetical protein [Pseudoxanthomonas sp. PXM02]MBD9478854.1 hypothetical protein [Pseudoxanthomonas sp. PXM02]